MVGAATTTTSGIGQEEAAATTTSGDGLVEAAAATTTGVVETNGTTTTTSGDGQEEARTMTGVAGNRKFCTCYDIFMYRTHTFCRKTR